MYIIIGRHIHETNPLTGDMKKFPNDSITFKPLSHDHTILFQFKSDYSEVDRGFNIWYQTSK